MFNICLHAAFGLTPTFFSAIRNSECRASTNYNLYVDLRAGSNTYFVSFKNTRTHRIVWECKGLISYFKQSRPFSQYSPKALVFAKNMVGNWRGRGFGVGWGEIDVVAKMMLCIKMFETRHFMMRIVRVRDSALSHIFYITRRIHQKIIMI